jgi:hypothetical protein
MSNDLFLDRLRDDARPLRMEIDSIVVTRITTAVRIRIASQPPTIYQFLAAWTRPMIASLVAVALSVTIGITWLETQHDSSVEAMSSPAMEIAMAGENLGVSN